MYINIYIYIYQNINVIIQPITHLYTIHIRDQIKLKIGAVAPPNHQGALTWLFSPQRDKDDPQPDRGSRSGGNGSMAKWGKSYFRMYKYQ